MCDDAPPKSRKSRPENEQDKALAVQIGVAVAGGLGIVGFVAFVGGAVMLMRFEAAGVPSEQALAVLPNSLLLVIGASTLVPLIAAMVAVFALAWMVYKGLQTHRQRRRGSAGQPPPVADKNSPGWRALGAAALTVVALGLYYLVTVDFKTSTPGLMKVLAAAVFAAALAVTAHRRLRERSWWRAVVYLLAAAIFTTVISSVRMSEHPEVRGAAVLLRAGSDAGITGFFIAETGGRVYLVRIDPYPATPNRTVKGDRMIVLPWSQIAELSVGTKQPIGKARGTAFRLLEELRRCQAPDTAACNGPPPMRSAAP